MISVCSMDHGHLHGLWWHHGPQKSDVNTDPGCSRTTDTNMALGGSTAQAALVRHHYGPRSQTGYPCQCGLQGQHYLRTSTGFQAVAQTMKSIWPYVIARPMDINTDLAAIRPQSEAWPFMAAQTQTSPYMDFKVVLITLWISGFYYNVSILIFNLNNLNVLSFG